MKKILLGAVIGAVITAFLFYKFMPRPGPEKTKIISGKMTGQAMIPSQKPKVGQEDGDNNKTNKVSGNYQITNETGSSDFVASVPVQGEIRTNHIDLQFSGITNVERKGDRITVDTVFDDNVKETIYPEVKTWHVGLYAGATEDGLGIGGFVQKDFRLATIKNVDLIGFGRVEIDRESKLLFGVEGNF